MNKTYKVIQNIWHKGKMLYRNSRLILSDDEAKEYLEIGAIKKIPLKEYWTGEYKMTKNPSNRGGKKASMGEVRNE